MKKSVGTALCLSLLLLTGCGSQATPSAGSAGQQTLSPFDSIEINVMAANIRVHPGEDWSVSYQFSEKETLKRCAVDDGTLHVETSFDPLERFSHEEWHVTVTVPAGTVLEDLELKTISGHVTVQDLTLDEGSLESTAGTITAEALTAQEVDATSVAGRISVTDSAIEDVDVETTSSGITLAGSFGRAEASSVSGEIDVSGALSQGAKLETISGAISLSASHSLDLQASSVGGIYLDGERQGSPVSRSSGAPLAELKSVSGKLTIQTQS